MATRFYLYASASRMPAPVSPAYHVDWEQQGDASRCALIRKQLNPLNVSTNFTATVPITTTQDSLYRQYVSEPLHAGVISGTVSTVLRTLQSATTINCTLALIIRACSQDGGTFRGTLYQNMNTDTEFPAVTAETRIVNAGVLTNTTVLDGDRLVVEYGAHFAGPTASGTYNLYNTTSAASDYALTSALTTSLNSWIEFSQDLFPAVSNNYQSATSSSPSTEQTGTMSVTERIR